MSGEKKTEKKEREKQERPVAKWVNRVSTAVLTRVFLASLLEGVMG